MKHLETPLGPSGMIEITTNDRSVSIWANSHHLCGELLTELDDQRINLRAPSDTKHKEEGEGRIKSDYEHRSKIRQHWINTSILQKLNLTHQTFWSTFTLAKN